MTTKQLTGAQESRLVRRAKKGDAEAFAQLYDAYIDRISRFVQVRVSNRHLAEDLTADTFLKAWDKLDGYEERGLSFGAWLFRIARNTVIDHYRTSKDEAPLEAAAGQGETTEVSQTVAQRLALQEVQRAMMGLTEAQREVLLLKFIVGLDTKTVAQVLKKRQGAVRALQMRGLQALNDVLGVPDG